MEKPTEHIQNATVVGKCIYMPLPCAMSNKQLGIHAEKGAKWHTTHSPGVLNKVAPGLIIRFVVCVCFVLGVCQFSTSLHFLLAAAATAFNFYFWDMRRTAGSLLTQPVAHEHQPRARAQSRYGACRMRQNQKPEHNSISNN